jgi:hypothetical protein
MLARIGIMRAQNHHVQRVFEPSGKSIIGTSQARARAFQIGCSSCLNIRAL